MLTYNQVPWLSFEEGDFPPRAPRRRRRILRSLLATEPVVYPQVEGPVEEKTATEEKEVTSEGTASEEKVAEPTEQDITVSSTPLPSEVPSDTASTQPTTPSSAVPAAPKDTQQTPTQPKVRPVGPVLPAVPVLPPSPSAARRTSTVSNQSKTSQPAQPTQPAQAVSGADQSSIGEDAAINTKTASEQATLVVSPPPAPKSWANLFRVNEPQNPSATTTASAANSNVSGGSKTETLSSVLHDMNSVPEKPSKISFLKPRGLVNTGNMCYMNSVSSPLGSVIFVTF